MGSPVAVGSGLSSPASVFVSNIGDIFVADTGNNAVKVMYGGAGNFQTISSSINVPVGVFVDDVGDVWVSGSGSPYCIYVGPIEVGSPLSPFSCGLVDAGGQPFVVGSGPWPSFDLFISDTDGNRVVLFPNGSSPPIQIGLGYSFSRPTGVFVDSASGNVYVADSANNAVVYIPSTGGSPTTVGEGFSNPNFAFFHAGTGNVFVADSGNSAVKVILGSTGSTTQIPFVFPAVQGVYLAC